MSKFGWDLPPGTSMADIDALTQEGPLRSEECEDGDHEYCEEEGCECSCHDEEPVSGEPEPEPVFTLIPCPNCGGAGSYPYQPEHGPAYTARCDYCGGEGTIVD